MTVFRKARIFLEMIKVEHTLFALPFAYLSLILAEGGWPRLSIFLWVTLAMVSFRTMGMAANRLIDEKIDGRNPRTRGRALPARKLSRLFVWIITVISFLIFEFCSFQLGPLCFYLSPAPVVLAWFYPWTKRFTWFSHFILGMILGIAPYGAWLASRAEFSWIPGLITIGVMAWVAAFDMIYALQDESFDRSHGLFSFPARFGWNVSLIMALLLHLITVASWLAAGTLAGRGIVYILGMAVVAFFLLREHWLVRSFGLKKIQEAFMMNAIVSQALFVAAVADFSLGRFFS